MLGWIQRVIGHYREIDESGIATIVEHRTPDRLMFVGNAVKSFSFSQGRQLSRLASRSIRDMADEPQTLLTEGSSYRIYREETLNAKALHYISSVEVKGYRRMR